MSMDLIDIAMAAAMKKGGGGGGTTDYTDLSNKPSINGNQLVGDKSTKQLGIKEPWVGTAAQYAQEAATIPAGTPIIITDDQDMDTVPTAGSSNPVTSDGIYRELAKLKVINENPENHNGIYRGKNLTNVYTIEQIYERVHDGSFEDLYLGDYFTVNITTDLYTRFTGAAFESGVTYYEMGGTVIARTWTETQDAEPQNGKVYATKQIVIENVDLMIAHFDYYLNRGVNGAIADHHIVFLPREDSLITQSEMHYSTAEMTPYKDTDMHNITLPCYAESFNTALNNHLMPVNLLLSSSIDPSAISMIGGGYLGASNNYAVATTCLALLTEQQITGNTSVSSSHFDVGIDYIQFAVFNFINPEFDHPSTDKYFLRPFVRYSNSSNVGSSYAQMSATGNIGFASANLYRGVYPYMLFG